MRKLLSTMVAVFSMGMTGSVLAQDFEKGMTAYNSNDFATALKEWRYLAERGHARAQWWVAYMYENGKGVFHSDKEAATWYRKAAEQGDATAQSNLGWMYEVGHGVIQDYVSSHMWYNIAASNGSENSSKGRDALTKKMSAADVSKAQELARECVKKKYKGC